MQRPLQMLKVFPQCCDSCWTAGAQRCSAMHTTMACSTVHFWVTRLRRRLLQTRHMPLRVGQSPCTKIRHTSALTSCVGCAVSPHGCVPALAAPRRHHNAVHINNHADDQPNPQQDANRDVGDFLNMSPEEPLLGLHPRHTHCSDTLRRCVCSQCVTRANCCDHCLPSPWSASG
jgi:hypothetical protein